MLARTLEESRLMILTCTQLHACMYVIDTDIADRKPAHVTATPIADEQEMDVQVDVDYVPQVHDYVYSRYMTMYYMHCVDSR